MVQLHAFQLERVPSFIGHCAICNHNFLYIETALRYAYADLQTIDVPVTLRFCLPAKAATKK